jgi:hypothetical protein
MIDVGTRRFLKMFPLQSGTKNTLDLHDAGQAFLTVSIFTELSLGKSAPTCQTVIKTGRQESAP